MEYRITAGGMAFTKEIRNVWEMRTSGVVMQKFDYSCGSAAMATLLNILGDTVREDEVIDGILRKGDIAQIVARKGFSILDLKRFASERGYKAEGYKADGIEELAKANTAVLLPIVINNYKHFVVFRGIKGDRVQLADPAKGNLTLPVYQFSDYWYENIFLLVNREGEPEPGFRRADAPYMEELWRFLQPPPHFFQHGINDLRRF
ncbi:MAG: hypothetical protein A2V21_306925 [Deltaproteobacteria bacterium GWC2_55_46]|nr:MAG: hypothetical protein A2V21_306925 [Deltaproteobacteria bacterium GWC2_55_46]